MVSFCDDSWTFIRPYRGTLLIAMIGVVIFTITQISIPLLIRFAIDKAFVGSEAGLELLHILVIGIYRGRISELCRQYGPGAPGWARRRIPSI